MSAACAWIVRRKPPRISVMLLLAALAVQVLIPSTASVVARSASAGLIVAAGGFALMLRAWWLFKSAQTAICPGSESRVLITQDVYRLTRNPMYLGIALMMTGVTVWAGTLPLLMATVVWVWLIDRCFCPFEEASLERQFGAEYLGYRNEVRRWA